MRNVSAWLADTCASECVLGLLGSEYLRSSKERRHELFEDFRVLGFSSGAVHGAHTVSAGASHLVIIHEFIQLP